MMSLAVALGKLIDPIEVDALMPGEPDFSTFGPIDYGGCVIRFVGDIRIPQVGGFPYAPVVSVETRDKLSPNLGVDFFPSEFGPCNGCQPRGKCRKFMEGCDSNANASDAVPMHPPGRTVEETCVAKLPAGS